MKKSANGGLASLRALKIQPAHHLAGAHKTWRHLSVTPCTLLRSCRTVFLNSL
ncbi:MAG: hypothetical protein OJF51_001570 [Nitrospira sp.]|nr:MAG: hypothetical protein OJF51_001570 [Nitrospira sp.]